MPRQKVPRALVDVLLREEKALDLRRRGYTYAQIGFQLGVGKRVAHRIVIRALGKHAKHCAETTEQILQMETAKLDALEQQLDGDSSHDAIALRLKIAERRAKLHGLDAPVKNELTGKDGVPLAPPVINIGFGNGGPGGPDPRPEGS